jgi:hypothetical protein
LTFILSSDILALGAIPLSAVPAVELESTKPVLLIFMPYTSMATKNLPLPKISAEAGACLR